MKHRERVLTLLTGYVDGELNKKQLIEMEALLKNHPELHDEYKAEKELKEALKEKIPMVEAPGYLLKRIRRDVQRAHIKPSFVELIQKLFEYRPVASAAAFAVIALLILVPAYQVAMKNFQSDGFVSNESVVKQGSIEGEIICLDCDIFSVVKASAPDDVELHKPGLRAVDGSIWTILRAEMKNAPRFGHGLLKQNARLVGLIFNNSRYIKVDDYQIL